MPSRPVRKIAPFVLALAALLVAACGTVKSPTAPGPAPGPGVQALTFTQIQTQVFTPTCAKAGCHARSAASGGMVLEAGASYAQIVNHPAQENPGLSRIAPGDPEHSYLLKKIRGDADISGTRMPQDGPPFLTSAQIDGIAAWIRAGAPNN
ncbi:MAG: hypothetical protein QOJ16_1678 [Acidobacteriota bacterium]|jgi:hypothetical protein|nr:hypothetical protein [Acidobacteriota bacterium]